MTATQPPKAAAHPSGDKRFKLLDRAINLHQGDGHALIEVLHTAQNVWKLNNDNIGKLLEKEAFQIYFEDSTAKELGNKLAYRLVPMQDESKRWDSMREVVVKEVALAQVGDREPSEKERNELQEIKNNFSDEVAEILWLNLLTKEQRENLEKIIELVDQLKEAHLECLADRIIGSVREQSFGLAAYTKLLECLDHHK